MTILDMHKEGAECGILMEQTAKALDSKVLQRLFVSTQRNNLELSMRYGIEKYIPYYIDVMERVLSTTQSRNSVY
jgi:hypothetical protein